MKRKTIATLLAIAMIMGFSVPAYAEDIPENAEQSQEQELVQEETPVTVSTLDELQTAVAAAEDGDTIALSKSIKLKNVSVVTDKDITLIPADSSVGTMFELGKDSQLSGFALFTNAVAVIVSNYEGGEISIGNCDFIGNDNYYNFLVNITAGNVYISDCNFKYGKDIALNISASSTVMIERCHFTENNTIMQGAGINNMGNCQINDSSFSDNTAGVGGGIYNSGTMEINRCTYSGNISTDSVGQDIVSTGTLNITDDPQDGVGYYEESTGVKVELPLADYASTAKLIYLTDEQAAEYFAPEEDNEQNGGEDNSNPDEPDEGEPENPTETPSEPPEQPDNGDDGDNPAEPEEPPTMPEQPQDKPDDSDDDYEPPVYRPVRPIKPVEPEPQPAPALTCNNAVIDTSRWVVLLGYGDGSLHENDPLTRAQLATIVYRLLDDDSIAMYDTDSAAQFMDVTPDAWYYRYVQTINRAGIVLGVGEGNYAPNGLVSWSQIITILSRFVEAQDYELQHIQYDGWALNAVQTAVALGWITDSAEFNPDAIISRGQLVDLVNSVLAMYR